MHHLPTPTTRRGFLRHTGAGAGALALSWLLARDAAAGGKPAANPLAARKPRLTRATSWR